jgi:Protein of unknown function (DUF938)
MTGVILEIANGSGEHVVQFARNFPSLAFQPSDPEPEALLSELSRCRQRLGRGEMTLDVKGVVDRGVRGEKFLRRTPDS